MCLDDWDPIDSLGPPWLLNESYWGISLRWLCGPFRFWWASNSKLYCWCIISFSFLTSCENPWCWIFYDGRLWKDLGLLEEFNLFDRLPLRSGESFNLASCLGFWGSDLWKVTAISDIKLSPYFRSECLLCFLWLEANFLWDSWLLWTRSDTFYSAFLGFYSFSL